MQQLRRQIVAVLVQVHTGNLDSVVFSALVPFQKIGQTEKIGTGSKNESSDELSNGMQTN